MHHANRSSKLLIAILLIFLNLTSQALSDTAAVGAIPAEFKVDAMGAASYTVPLSLPPGTAGMDLGLALAYSSHNKNGLVGMGWSLSGLSIITRCPATPIQDGFSSGVNFNLNDRFCLNGQHLVAINGSYGGNGTEYRTEVESFTRVISYGQSGYGPTYFKAWTKSGQIIEYGVTGDSRIESQDQLTARVWAMNKVQDSAGNYFIVTYTEDNAAAEYYPARIDYTGNVAAGLTPAQSVQFFYQARPDIAPLYQAGSSIKTTVRLANVKTYTGATLVQDYQLRYQQGTATVYPRIRLH